MAGWPSAWSGSAVLVGLPAHTFFVPFYLSAFQLLLIQSCTSVAGMEFDPIAVDIVISNFKKTNKQWEWEKACSNLSSLFSVLLGSAFVPFCDLEFACPELQRKTIQERLSWLGKLGCS